jgi:Ca2+-binding EF-hand superfamily protein
MNVGSVGTSSYLYSLNGTSTKATQSGKTNLSKEDLSSMESQIESLGIEVPSLLKDIASNFDKIDTNGDGISSDEMQAYAKANGLSLPTQRKHHSDEAMTKDDLIKMLDQMKESGDSNADVISAAIDGFDAADTNKDGKISLDEMQAFAEANGLTLSEPPSRETQGMNGMNGQTPPALSKDDLTKMRDEMKANGDTNVDAFSLAIDQFDTADADQDGKISFDEMQSLATANGITLQPPRNAHGAHGSQGRSSQSNAEDLATLLKVLQQNSVSAYTAYESSYGASDNVLGKGLTA